MNYYEFNYDIYSKLLCYAGKITIVDDALIAPGTFVNFDVPNLLYWGIQGKIITFDNAVKGYINNVVKEVRQLKYRRNDDGSDYIRIYHHTLA